MRRREVILMFAGAAASYPLMAWAQQPLQMRRIGVVMLYPENDPQGQLRATAFQRQLEKAGWTIGGNLQVNFSMGHWRRRLGAVSHRPSAASDT